MKKIKQKSINFKIFMGFFSILMLIISLTWILEIVFFDSIYKQTNKIVISEIMEDLTANFSNYTEDDFYNISQKEEIGLIIFSNNDTTNIIFDSSRSNPFLSLDELITTMLEKFETSSYVEFYSTGEKLDTITIGQMVKINEVNIYFYINMRTTPTDGLLNIITILLIIITIISAVVAFFTAIILSRKISKPIKEISAKAEILSLGNLDIEFTSDEYIEIKQLSETLNFSINEIKKSQQLQKDLIQNVSHELRTPLTIIKSYVEMIEDFNDNDDKKRSENLKVIMSEADKLQRLIDDLIDLSKMQSNTAQYKIEKVNLSELFDNLVTIYQNKYIDFVIEKKYNSNIYIECDKNRIIQAITNILNNSILYSADDKRITVQIDKSVENYKLIIKDYGIGIPNAEQSNIFNRNYRASNTESRVDGSGVGLAIVKEILNYHNFPFGLVSTENQGTEFYIIFKKTI